VTRLAGELFWIVVVITFPSFPSSAWGPSAKLLLRVFLDEPGRNGIRGQEAERREKCVPKRSVGTR
jgi:hypothetical protein